MTLINTVHNGRPITAVQVGPDTWVASYTDQAWNGGWHSIPPTFLEQLIRESKPRFKYTGIIRESAPRRAWAVNDLGAGFLHDETHTTSQRFPEGNPGFSELWVCRNVYDIPGELGNFAMFLEKLDGPRTEVVRTQSNTAPGQEPATINHGGRTPGGRLRRLLLRFFQ